MIGQELHDGLGQQLTGIAFLVSSLSETLGVKSAPEVSTVRQVEHLLGEAMSVIRALSRGLYPIALETGGLSSALHHLSEYAQGSSGVQCAVRCTINTHLIDKTIALNLYRIAQEAFCNALRHSKAQRIEIKLSEAGEEYRLSVEDNGIGFPSQAYENKGNARLAQYAQSGRLDRGGNRNPQKPGWRLGYHRYWPHQTRGLAHCQTKIKPAW